MSDNIVKSFEASEDMSATQYHACQPATGNKFCAIGTDSERTLGIQLNKAASGKAVEVCVGGVCPGILGEGSLSAGDFLTADTIGHWVQTGAADEFIGAMLLDDSDTVVDLDVRDMLIMHALAHAADTGM